MGVVMKENDNADGNGKELNGMKLMLERWNRVVRLNDVYRPLDL